MRKITMQAALNNLYIVKAVFKNIKADPELIDSLNIAINSLEAWDDILDELGDIDRLTPGTTFYKCGGTRTKYPPKGQSVKPRTEVIDGHRVEVASYAIITNTTKELHSAVETREVPIFWESQDAIL